MKISFYKKLPKMPVNNPLEKKKKAYTTLSNLRESKKRKWLDQLLIKKVLKSTVNVRYYTRKNSQ